MGKAKEISIKIYLCLSAAEQLLYHEPELPQQLRPNLHPQHGDLHHPEMQLRWDLLPAIICSKQDNSQLADVCRIRLDYETFTLGIHFWTSFRLIYIDSYHPSGLRFLSLRFKIALVKSSKIVLA